MTVNTTNTMKLQPEKPRRKVHLKQEKIAPYIFVLPFILTFLVFFLYPIISTVLTSFQEVLGPGDAKFIGLKNYRNMINEHFFNALWVTTRYTFWTILVLVPIPMLLSIVLNRKNILGRNIFRSAFFLPALTSVIVAGLFFRLAFGEQDTTLVNMILGFFGIPKTTWLQRGHTAMFVMVVLSTWRWLGVNVIYFLSGLQNIPVEQYESASIDGASEWRKFLSITVPGLKPVITYVVTISIYGGYSMFAESYTLFGPRSPGDIGLTMVSLIYQQGFNENNFGAGSAIGITLLIILMAVNMIQLALTGFFKKEGDD
ncbi:binding-protein-dependent transport systems inner membrane component [Ruminiclostridium papyrosolvens DSM 2782]|uniref:Binding-protein-dependent transport systems inner membrane component n=1 Tax=Ruminiclostridium papyrosolvens DSM 2782 TaxID=588581 RepID=F1THI5_9FIRM|nr:sugar ABC transporter permease [Ruminiclostridium papyrosolvens]EGD46188.1 binding-protein-dependent transport systems inner membrane component [Ruminiclostridium papyrosolvens DSM 2782]WES35968.1 sugar ABC transporter permease [Ruminiclostridium papyrosolvens DSM 2782]